MATRHFFSECSDLVVIKKLVHDRVAWRMCTNCGELCFATDYLGFALRCLAHDSNEISEIACTTLSTLSGNLDSAFMSTFVVIPLLEELKQICNMN